MNAEQQQVTVSGTVSRVNYAREETGWRSLRVEVAGGAVETWVGVMPSASPGERVNATGSYSTHAKYGRQFDVATCMPVVPTTAAGLARYLGSGFLPGLGAALAQRIVEAFGEKTMETLDKNPGQLACVKGVTAAKAAKIGAAWAEKRAVAVIMAFLQQHGASPSLAGRIYAAYKERAVDVVTRTPYLLAVEVDGVGFHTADRIARAIGIGVESEDRAQAAVLHALKEQATKGHCFTEQADLARVTVDFLAGDELDEDVRGNYARIVYGAIRTLAQARRVRLEDLGDEKTAVFGAGLYRAEARLADRLRKILAAPASVPKDAPKVGMEALALQAIAEFEAEKKVQLAPQQREAVMLAAREKVLVVTGGPGTGKTSVTLALLRLFDRAKLATVLAAPTGRAAKRLNEATARSASTIHRLLEYRPGVGFTKKADSPLAADVVLLDEVSMVDLPLADHLVQAIDLGARVVFVGDIDQLPSVGPGAVLRDIIESGGVPTVRLSQVFRQAEGSLITRNAHAINRGERPVDGADPMGEFHIVTCTDQPSAADAILDAVTRWLPQRFGLDPVADIQVLCPMRKGEAGVGELNRRLQAALNGGGLPIAGSSFRTGDKVMQLKNDYERDVFNGDMGYVDGVNEDGDLLVNVDGRSVAYEAKHLEQLMHAYVTTIHRGQGAEYPAVVIPILNAHYVMLVRNLLYTAVTRAKRVCVLVGDPKAIATAVRQTKRDVRRTRLAVRLGGA